jgi:hypothetical protein
MLCSFWEVDMRIVEQNPGKPLRPIKSVMLMLTPSEAKELADSLQCINPEEGDHIHVNDIEYKREITAFIYTPENLNFFADDIVSIIFAEE